MKYARIVNDVAVEVFTPPEGVPITDCFTPEVAAQFTPVPDEVEGGWSLIDGVWTAPVPPAPPPTPDEVLYQEIVTSTQQRLDDFAATRGYDGILSAVSYATSPTQKFQIEGTYCLEQRDATWAALIQMYGEVEAGTRPKPTSYADIEPDLPPLVWPN